MQNSVNFVLLTDRFFLSQFNLANIENATVLRNKLVATSIISERAE